MLDFGFSEILLTSAIALVVLGPERLPKVARQVGNWMGRARAMARQLSEQLEREVDADELLKTQTRKLEAPLATRLAPAQTVPQAEPMAAPPMAHVEYTPPATPETSSNAVPAAIGVTDHTVPPADSAQTSAPAANGSDGVVANLATPLTPMTEVPSISAEADDVSAGRASAGRASAGRAAPRPTVIEAPVPTHGTALKASTPLPDHDPSTGEPADEATVPLLRALSLDAETKSPLDAANPRNE